MSRAVRFEDTLPLTPDELFRPQHGDKANNPKGILLKEGTFELKLQNGKVPSRRDRRYSTPVEDIAKMQNAAILEANQLRHDQRSRRRSVSGGLMDSHQHSIYQHQYDSTPAYTRAPHSLARARDSLQPPSRPLLSPARTQSFTVPPRHPYNSHATLNRRDTARWPQDDIYRFQPLYDGANTTIHQRGQEMSTTWTGYPGAGPNAPQAPLGFVQTYGSSAGTRSSTHYSPESQADSRYLPDPRPKLSLKDVVIQKHLKNPRITWNLAFPFSSAAFDSHSKLMLSELDNTATVPAIDKFTIKFEYSKTQKTLRSIWRSIKVRGSYPYTMDDGTTVCLITIRDVLNAIFDFFQMPVTQSEYNSLTSDEAQMVLHAQRRRVGSHAYSFGEPLRVDALGEFTRFEGVRISSFKEKEKKISFGLELGRW